jgi:hypothetical protein
MIRGYTQNGESTPTSRRHRITAPGARLVFNKLGGFSATSEGCGMALLTRGERSASRHAFDELAATGRLMKKASAHPTTESTRVFGDQSLRVW